jgi:hypothetical protein
MYYTSKYASNLKHRKLQGSVVWLQKQHKRVYLIHRGKSRLIIFNPNANMGAQIAKRAIHIWAFRLLALLACIAM